MAEQRSIRVPDLLIDPENPRIAQAGGSQREAHQAIAKDQQTKLLELAKDILAHGLNPSKLPLVKSADDDRDRYVVLEGNRRLTALKALENPETLVGAVDDKVLGELRDLSKKYHENPVESVQCVVVKNRQDALHWIMLEHTGENSGAGIVRWGADEQSRFRQRFGSAEFHTQALDFLETRNQLTLEERRKLPVTSFKRLLGTPEVRAKCGIEIEDGGLEIVGDEDEVAKALLYIVRDLSSGKKTVRDIYNRAARVAYAESMPADVVVKKSKSTNDASDTKKADSKGKAKSAKARRSRPSDHVVPSDCILSVTDPRTRDILLELRRLSLETYTNSVAVMLRVFIELSVDHYITAQSLTSVGGQKLREKIGTVVNHLVAGGRLTKDQARPVRRAMQKDSYLAPSVDLMHEFVHNRYTFPSPSDLRAHWKNLQPFINGIWPPR